MKDWERIRANRPDLTDFVIHFTRYRIDTIDGQRVYRSPRDILQEILAAGYIRPTFAPLPNRYSPTTPRATVKGPVPAVCLTEQPIWAVLKNGSRRYSGYGIAYHKCILHGWGARPVTYGTKEILGERIKEGEPDYEEGKDIFRDGLPVGFQYLWVMYQPAVPGSGEYPVDFTWEREWRFRAWSSMPGLPVARGNFSDRICEGAIIVEEDEDVPILETWNGVESRCGAVV